MRTRRKKVASKGPEVVITLAAICFMTLAGMCVYIRGCGVGNQAPVFAAQIPSYLQQPPWNLYTAPLTINQSTTVKAVAVTDAGAMSPISTGTFTIDPPGGSQRPGFIAPSIAKNGGSVPRAASFRTVQMESIQGFYAHHGLVLEPNPAVTPGVASLTSKEQVCSSQVRPGQVQPVSEQVRYEVCAEYGIDQPHCVGLQPDGFGFKIDPLIPLELGGANEKDNLWPQPYSPRPAAPEKIAIGQWLRSQVCTDQMDLGTAQRAISGDWYQTFLTALEGGKQWPQSALIEKTRFRPKAASGKFSGGMVASEH